MGANDYYLVDASTLMLHRNLWHFAERTGTNVLKAVNFLNPASPLNNSGTIITRAVFNEITRSMDGLHPWHVYHYDLDSLTANYHIPPEDAVLIHWMFEAIQEGRMLVVESDIYEDLKRTPKPGYKHMQQHAGETSMHELLQDNFPPQKKKRASAPTVYNIAMRHPDDADACPANCDPVAEGLPAISVESVMVLIEDITALQEMANRRNKSIYPITTDMLLRSMAFNLYHLDGLETAAQAAYDALGRTYDPAGIVDRLSKRGYGGDLQIIEAVRTQLNQHCMAA